MNNLAFALGFKSKRGEISREDPRHLLLQRVMQAHTLLNITVENEPETVLSALIELVPERGYLVLDAFKPALPATATANNPAIEVSTRLDGVALSFTTRITAQGELDGAAYYKAPYPDELDHAQRRREFRVTVPLAKGATLRAVDAVGAVLEGELRDLSPSGFSASISPEAFEQLERKTQWQGRCTLSMPGTAPFKGIMEICHRVPGTATAAPRIGARFLDLDPRTERRIERYVVELDREQARLR